MSLLELLCEKFINSKLFENAFHRQEVESRITSLANPITKHLIKILKWNDSINYNKHIGDIDGWIYDIQLLQIKDNKRPTQMDYFKWMFTDYAENEIGISRLIKGLHRYHRLPVLHTDENVHMLIKAILLDISIDLSLNKYNGLDTYLKKYKIIS